MAAYEIPLTPEAQTFSIVLAGINYNITLQWRDPAPGWVLDIATQEGALLVGGISLVTGTDLLEPYAYLGFGGELRVYTDGDADAVPTFESLGTESKLYFLVDD